ncbi:MAG: type II toxin-antitoxin system death-on-curing family toxin [Polyangia bacterium]|jgi:death-on-curing protein|nr:type II toxin-antitoxin system death-on-curing family toxin [Polyangia bacterium]
MTPELLSVEDVLELHAVQLERYGGGAGLRDLALLESAVAQPHATFDGDLLHADLFAMAAAYLFHIVSNHPFVDGNKRVGLLSALVFLDLNGVSIASGSESLYEVTMAVAAGRASKVEVTEVLRRIAETA